MTDRREATLWFLAFVGVVVVGGVLEPIGREGNDLPPALVTVFFVLNVLAPSSLAIVVLQYFLRQKDTAMSLLSVEREKSDDLLRNVLPTDIATELKENGSVVARRFDAVSVLVRGYRRLHAADGKARARRADRRAQPHLYAVRPHRRQVRRGEDPDYRRQLHGSHRCPATPVPPTQAIWQTWHSI